MQENLHVFARQWRTRKSGVSYRLPTAQNQRAAYYCALASAEERLNTTQPAMTRFDIQVQTSASGVRFAKKR